MITPGVAVRASCASCGSLLGIGVCAAVVSRFSRKARGSAPTGQPAISPTQFSANASNPASKLAALCSASATGSRSGSTAASSTSARTSSGKSSA
jgi:hypothetical protein